MDLSPPDPPSPPSPPKPPSAPRPADADPDLRALAEAVRDAGAVAPVGARTQWEVGGPVPHGVELRAPAGVVSYDPADMTITVGAGTAYDDLREVLAEHAQECPLDPRDPSATVGGIVATGLSGPRRLHHGPLRDAVLEVRFVTGDARLVKGGGPTVKNATGYDLPRLLVGSFGTIGLLGRLTLRCRPRAETSRWGCSDEHPAEVRARLHRPSSMLWDGRRLHVLLEGHPADVAAQAAAGRLAERKGPPPFPEGPHRGRISVPPGALAALGVALDGVAGCRWLAECGVGTVHVAADSAAALAAARRTAHDHAGWLLREAGGNGLDGFGLPLPNAALLRRVKQAFDPAGKLAPGRLPL